jgi:hypothetical protein
LTHILKLPGVLSIDFKGFLLFFRLTEISSVCVGFRNISFLKVYLNRFFLKLLIGLRGGANTIFSEKLVKILNKKSKNQLKKEQIGDKLRKQERLSSDEFWSVYNSIRQEGPEVKFKNPNRWMDPGE